MTLRTVIRNAGDLAVQNPAVGFYDGDPKLGGTLVTNVTLSGWLEGSGTNEVTALWVLPESGSPHTVFAVVDPKGAKEDAGFTGNNRQSLRLGGTDLAVNLRSQTVETNGALRVVAEVRNLGAPTAGKSLLTLRKPGTEGGALVSAEVGTLEPGRVSQVALDLPEGSVAEGETLYALAVDEGAVVVDADRSNNTSTFAVTLVIDSDGDGMPDAWERQAGFDSSSAADALGDTDGDGVSNRDEYRAGTNPHEATSYLRLVGVGYYCDGRGGGSLGQLGGPVVHLVAIGPGHRGVGTGGAATPGGAARELVPRRECDQRRGLFLPGAGGVAWRPAFWDSTTVTGIIRFVA